MAPLRHLRDGIRLWDESDGSSLVFHHLTWVSVIQGCIERYAGLRPDEAEALIQQAGYAEPVLSAGVAALLTHDIEYHWAMLAVHGNGYWHEKNIHSQPPPDHDDWDTAYRRAHALKASAIDFGDWQA